MNGREEAIRNRYRPYKANVAPINPGQDDWRSYQLRNQAIQNANEVRERRATVENEDWLMSRPAHWYKELDDQGEPSNWRAAKNVLKHIPAVTTDINENRNMFQMLANQMLGGDKGARLIDTRGLPDQARRYGSNLFYDPEKAPGFFPTLRTWAGDIIPGVSRSPSPATLRVNEWNPFPNFGQEGRDWYVDQFGEPWGEKLEGLLKLALPGPLKWMKGNKKEPLPSDRSWVPENVGAYNEIPEIPFMGEEVDETIVNTPIDANETGNWWYTPPFDDEVTIMDLPIDEDITETITEDDGEKFVLKEAEFSQGNLGTEGKYDYSPTWDLNIMNIQDYELKKKATDAAIQFNNMWKSGESDMYELEKLYDAYLAAVEAGVQ